MNITKSSTKTLEEDEEKAVTTSMETQQPDGQQNGPIQQPSSAAITRVDAVELGIPITKEEEKEEELKAKAKVDAVAKKIETMAKKMVEEMLEEMPMKITKSSTKTLEEEEEEEAVSTSMETQQSDGQQNGPIQQPSSAAITRVDAVELGIPITKEEEKEEELKAKAKVDAVAKKIETMAKKMVEEMLEEMPIPEKTTTTTTTTTVINLLESMTKTTNLLVEEGKGLMTEAATLKNLAEKIAVITDEKVAEKMIETAAAELAEKIKETVVKFKAITEKIVEEKMPPIEAKVNAMAKKIATAIKEVAADKTQIPEETTTTTTTTSTTEKDVVEQMIKTIGTAVAHQTAAIKESIKLNRELEKLFF